MLVGTQAMTSRFCPTADSCSTDEDEAKKSLKQRMIITNQDVGAEYAEGTGYTLSYLTLGTHRDDGHHRRVSGLPRTGPR